ncbi:MAG TPA: PLP-dependent aminotransferase family protein [Myxococcaceae bacterium]|nr:PLP-dependent aminotransferase family protein [Myxococcaceae bacterium]
MTVRTARRMRGVVPSAVREILKVAERPDVLSFAGGLPAPELFPARELSQAFEAVLRRRPAAALQYGITEGFLPLREWLAARLRARGIPATSESVMVVSGSQQGIDLVARVLLDPGDTVLVENPSYLAALQAFAAYEVNVVALPGDDDGLRTGLLEEAVREHRPALIYLVPEFQNPRGTTLAGDRRRELATVAARHGVPVLEDDPYGALRFRGSPSTPIAALADGLTFHLGTFSKTLAPGLRLGWVHGPKPLVRTMTIAKQACDLQTATLAQHAVVELLETFDYEAHLRRIRSAYRTRCEAMLQALERTMPAGTRWSTPDGGLFLWLELPPGLRDDQVFHAAIQRSVAVVPGSGFFVGPPEHGFLRLNFSNQSAANIELGMDRLGQTLAELQARSMPLRPRQAELHAAPPSP